MNYRHGDLALISVKELPDNLEKSFSKILMKGSHGNNHSFDEGEFFLKKNSDIVFGYLVAGENTNLFHISHGEKTKNKRLRKAKINPDIYELRKQHEETHEGMKPIID